MKNIGIITSGGDCGGLNGVIKGAALTALSKGLTAYIVPNGYAGLYNLVDFKSLAKLTAERSERPGYPLAVELTPAETATLLAVGARLAEILSA